METPILFKFVKMDLAQFATLTDDCVEYHGQLDIANRFQFAYSFEEHTVLCKTVIEVSRSGNLLLKAELDCYFMIEFKSAAVIEAATEAIIPAGLLAQFASLAYGSMRGAIYVKAAGTSFDSFILPPADVASAFTGPQRFKRRIG